MMKNYENIQGRRSIRTFLKQPLREENHAYLSTVLSDIQTELGPFGNRIQLWESHLKDEKKIGTYGMIKHPAGYVVGSVDHSDEGLIDYGYLFEKMILALNEKKIGTCWMAGTFKRKGMIATNNQLIPAVSPIGHYDQSRFFEKMMRHMVKADLRKPFESLFYKNDFDTVYVKDTQPLTEALEGVRLGPSASNKQPWRLLIREDKVHFYLAEDKKYNAALGFKVQYLDMGIAMYHLEAVLKDHHIIGEWLKDNPNVKTPNNHLYIATYKIKS